MPRHMHRLYTGKNKWVLLDEADLEHAKRATLRWHTRFASFGEKWTTYCWVEKENGAKHRAYLTHFLAGFPEGKKVTFVNKNRKDLRRKNLRVGGIKMDLNLPKGLSLDLVEGLVCRKVLPTEPAPPVKLESVLIPGGTRHFVPDPNSKLGPVVQYKIWLKQQGETPRGSTHA